MKRFLLVVLLGFVAGAATHIGFYAFRRPAVENRLAHNLAWMRTEFALDDQQYQRISALHDRTGPELERLFSVLRTTRGLYVGGGGTLVVTMLGADSTFVNVPTGTILPIQVQKVKAATIATNILALY